MKTAKMKSLLLALLTVGLGLVWTAPGESKSKAPGVGIMPLTLGQKLSLAVESHPVEWKNNTYHMVRLGSIQFDLDKESSQLKAEIQAGTTSFDNVDYDVSVAVFDAAGALLGTARAKCKVQRVWLGNVLTEQRSMNLDFGTSLDYASAASFSASISRRKVLTPDDWQAKK